MPQQRITALEFYSGIGGMHYALKNACPSAVVLSAFDINHTANAVYTHNFHQAPQQVDLATLTAAALDEYAADLWLMAPPCQPFTRQGKQLGGADARSSSFLHLLQQLQLMQRPPQGLLVENVVGFQGSDVHRQLTAALAHCGYYTQEFILSPVQYAVPYSRPRYFCVASKQPLPVSMHEGLQQQQQQQHPCLCTPTLLLQLKAQGADARQLAAAAHQQLASHVAEVPTLQQFLSLSSSAQTDHPTQHQQQLQLQGRHMAGRQQQQQQQQQQLVLHVNGEQQEQQQQDMWVPDKVLQKHADVIDVVTGASRSCNCFTKAYGHFARGTGSLLATVPDPAAVDARWQLVGGSGSLELRGYQSSHQQQHDDEAAGGSGDDSSNLLGPDAAAAAAAETSESLAAAWRQLRLRYFTPGEIAQLHSLPPGFKLPSAVSCRQAYQLLGNSLSVAVLTDLLSYLLAAAD